MQALRKITRSDIKSSIAASSKSTCIVRLYLFDLLNSSWSSSSEARFERASLEELRVPFVATAPLLPAIFVAFVNWALRSSGSASLVLGTNAVGVLSRMERPCLAPEFI